MAGHSEGDRRHVWHFCPLLLLVSQVAAEVQPLLPHLQLLLHHNPTNCACAQYQQHHRVQRTRAPHWDTMLLQRQVLSRAQSSSERIWCRHLLPGEKLRTGKCDHCFMSILGILCFYWLNFVPNNISVGCWESFVGQSVINRFTFISLFQNCYSVIGTMCIQSLGVPEFDIARNVLDLIYAQTLAWIGIYFSPVLPVITIIQSLCPCSQDYIASVDHKMNRPPYVTVFYSYSLKPSVLCEPFQGLDTPFHTIFSWTHSLPENHWVRWIFENILRSELFCYLISLIIL
uniref:Transmembrane channel-like protein n=1 Tax=Cyprinus carpio TaxID=7962 RepID=A0A8C1U6W6_CYPCA